MLKKIKKIIEGLKSRQEYTEEELREIISESKDNKIISDDEEKLIDSIFELEDTIIEEIMTSRMDMNMAPHDADLIDVIKIINESGYSKIPVYHYKLDNIAGIIYAKDILNFLSDNKGIKAVEIIRAPYFIPETKSVISALREFQEKRISIAIVIDEYGGVAGLVTMEDILEEIVGEVEDELDKKEFIYTKLSENTYLVDAKMDLDDFNNLMNTNFEFENVNSIAGLILTELEYIPKINEKIKINDMEFTIADMTKNRIKRIIVKDLRDE